MGGDDAGDKLEVGGTDGVGLGRGVGAGEEGEVTFEDPIGIKRRFASVIPRLQVRIT